ncbi:hypothetical protein HJFPF1_10067 [Paramyrothecium foliicola]|nr:hypothetical protein HJFPF1_10067 [Paramyrothecium foliicola]
MILTARDEEKEVHPFVNPFTELNVGLWSLFLGATFFLALRIWVKIRWRHGLWYDDYILIVSWMILLANNSLIIHEFATGYVLEDSSKKWDDRMHILISVSSCGTLVGQALSKTAFGVTLLRIASQRQSYVIWFCIATMNLWMILKVIFQWAKVCGKDNYQQYWRLDFCIGSKFREDFKEGGNVYNIIMDFVFATFPWLIARRLELRRVEKIGLCLTMSLGIVVAVVAAVRVAWKDDGNDRDSWYIWRNGMSQVWYSSEIAGTILVQCIPVLRPILRDVHTTWTSDRLDSSGRTPSTIFSKRFSSRVGSTGINYANHFKDKEPAETVELKAIPEQTTEIWAEEYTPTRTSREGGGLGNRTGAWPLGNDMAKGDTMERKSQDIEQGRTSRSTFSMDNEQNNDQGLSAPPRRLPSWPLPDRD